jgi:hypothetical protein
MGEAGLRVRQAVVGQNFLYDMRFLWQQYGIACPNTDDTMLLHHSLYPELQKGLGVPGINLQVTNVQTWKVNRDLETVKRED